MHQYAQLICNMLAHRKPVQCLQCNCDMVPWPQVFSGISLWQYSQGITPCEGVKMKHPPVAGLQCSCDMVPWPQLQDKARELRSNDYCVIPLLHTGHI